MPTAGFELTISAGKRPQTLYRAATGAGSYTNMLINVILSSDEHNCSEELYILCVSRGLLNNRFQLRNVSDNEVGFKHKETCLLRFQSVVVALLLGFFEPSCLDSLAVSP